jgi:hypothetical protein
MRTEAQLQAARRNGRLSRGPVTPEGKRIVSQNAVRHGLLAAGICRHAEDREKFAALLEGYRSEHDPQTQTEEDLVEQLAVAKWKELRAACYQAHVLDAQAARMAESVEKEFEGATPGMLAALSFGELADRSTRPATLHRYEAHAQRIWRLALKQLHDQQARRAKQKLPNKPGQPVETTSH